MAEAIAPLNPQALTEGREIAASARDLDFDLDLASRLRTGEEDAYEDLIQRFQNPVYNLVYRLLKDPADTPDVVQEVFLKVFRNIEQFRGQSSLKTWIYRIAVNEANNHKRWFWRHRRPQISLEGEESEGTGYLSVLPDSGPSPFEYVSDRETQRLVNAALMRVKDPYRTAVILRDIEELSYEEIAAILHQKMGTVKSRIIRGRECLREELAGTVASREHLELPQRSLERAL